jgi:hypothetical protein
VEFILALRCMRSRSLPATGSIAARGIAGRNGLARLSAGDGGGDIRDARTLRLGKSFDAIGLEPGGEDHSERERRMGDASASGRVRVGKRKWTRVECGSQGEIESFPIMWIKEGAHVGYSFVCECFFSCLAAGGSRAWGLQVCDDIPMFSWQGVHSRRGSVHPADPLAGCRKLS